MWNINKIRKAWKIATKFHDGQKYGGPNTGEQIEYLEHIGAVVLEIQNSLQYENNVNEELAIICSILHDTIEDTKYDKEDLRKEFGESIFLGVMALTKNDKLETKELMMEDSLSRILEQPREISMVKMADRICNLESPPYYWNKEKIIKYRDEAILIHKKLQKGSKYLSNRLQEKIERYGDYID